MRLQLEFDEKSKLIFSKVEPNELSRILSNLINNAVASILDVGIVKITLTCGQKVIITVEDTGMGISPSVLDKLGAKGATFGKQAGTGLGIYHAKKNVASWGGKLEITSKEKVGTIVTITLPKSNV